MWSALSPARAGTLLGNGDSAMARSVGQQSDTAFSGGLCGIPRTWQGQGSQSTASISRQLRSGSRHVTGDVASNLPQNLGQLPSLKQLKFWLSEIEHRSLPQKN